MPPSIFDEPINFNRYEVPEDYYEMRESKAYWIRQAEK
jgi:hypothetical protein